MHGLVFQFKVLMRSLKTSGGLTRGRGFDENRRAQWILAMPACAEYNNAMQDLTGMFIIYIQKQLTSTHRSFFFSLYF